MSKNSEFWESTKFFKKSEFSCKCGCGFNIINHDLVSKLDKARILADTPFSLNSACRCKEHNSVVHGSVSSSHLKGYAVDIRVNSSSDRFKILQALMSVGFNRIGVYKKFIHCDNDNDKLQNVIWYK